MARQSFPESATEITSRVQGQINNATASVGQLTSQAAGAVDQLTNQATASVSQITSQVSSVASDFGFSGTGASVNPNATFLARLSEQFTAAQAEFESRLPADGSFIDKEALDGLTDRLSGSIGSGLNGLSDSIGGVTGAIGDAAGAIGDQVGGIASGIGGLASRFQTELNEGIETAQDAISGASNLSSDISGALNKLTGGNLAGGLQDAASAISGAAGQLNNILSIFRGSNLPEGGEQFLDQSSPVRLAPNNKDDWRVKVNTNWEIFGGNVLFSKLAATGGVVFPYLPTITFSTKANYTSVETVHSNYPFQAYKNSAVDEISISGEFSCETETDAAYWIAATTFFKTATKMFFGTGANSGNPPIICSLSGYGSSVFDRVPVVVKSFTLDLNDSVNYIKCNTFGTSTWVPVLSTITITVSPIYNRTNLRRFNLEDYAKGNLVSRNNVGYL